MINDKGVVVTNPLQLSCMEMGHRQPCTMSLSIMDKGSHKTISEVYVPIVRKINYNTNI